MERREDFKFRIYDLFEVFADLEFFAVHVSGMVINDLSFGIEDKEMRDVLDVHRPFKRTIGVEQDVIFPSVAVHQRHHFLGILRLIDRDDVHLHARLILPVGIEVFDGVEFAHTGLTPGREERDDHRLAGFGKVFDIDRTPLRVPQCNIRKDGIGGYRAEDKEETKKEFFHIRIFFDGGSQAENLKGLPFIVLDIFFLFDGFGERHVDDFSVLESNHDRALFLEKGLYCGAAET